MCTKPEGAKFQAAADWGIKTLRFEWYDDSIKAGYALPEREYLLLAGNNVDKQDAAASVSSSNARNAMKKGRKDADKNVTQPPAAQDPPHVENNDAIDDVPDIPEDLPLIGFGFDTQGLTRIGPKKGISSQQQLPSTREAIPADNELLELYSQRNIQVASKSQSQSEVVNDQSLVDLEQEIFKDMPDDAYASQSKSPAHTTANGSGKSSEWTTISNTLDADVETSGESNSLLRRTTKFDVEWGDSVCTRSGSKRPRP